MSDIPNNDHSFELLSTEGKEIITSLREIYTAYKTNKFGLDIKQLDLNNIKQLIERLIQILSEDSDGIIAKSLLESI